MKKKLYCSFFVMLFLVAILFAHTPDNTQKTLAAFVHPVQFRPIDIQYFFLERFNDRFYAESFLPLCFLHMEDFLHYSAISREPRVLALVTLDLFHQKLKEARWVNPFALSILLKQLPMRLGPLCADELDVQKSKTKQIIFDAIEADFDRFKNDPEEFITTLADSIVEEIVNPSVPTAREVSEMAVRFIESALDKVIWDPRDQEYTWESVKLIAQQLEVLHDHNIIIYEKDLNHLLWSLISRFCYFVEISGNDLSMACYQIIKEDINDCAARAPFLLKEELEAYSLTKKDRLMEVVLAGEVALKLERSETVQPLLA